MPTAAGGCQATQLSRHQRTDRPARPSLVGMFLLQTAYLWALPCSSLRSLESTPWATRQRRCEGGCARSRARFDRTEVGCRLQPQPHPADPADQPLRRRPLCCCPAGEGRAAPASCHPGHRGRRLPDVRHAGSGPGRACLPQHLLPRRRPHPPLPASPRQLHFRVCWRPRWVAGWVVLGPR